MYVHSLVLHLRAYVKGLQQYTTEKLGEPLNIIISSESDDYILTEQGMQTYIK